MEKRKDWEKVFEKYAKEGKNKIIIPDYINKEVEEVLEGEENLN